MQTQERSVYNVKEKLLDDEEAYLSCMSSYESMTI